MIETRRVALWPSCEPPCRNRPGICGRCTAGAPSRDFITNREEAGSMMRQVRSLVGLAGTGGLSGFEGPWIDRLFGGCIRDDRGARRLLLSFDPACSFVAKEEH